MEEFIECIIDSTTDLPGWEYTDTRYFYLNGGCYELAKIIKHFVPDTELLINDSSDHCAILYNGKAYDATGEVNINNFKLATQEDIDYIENSFGIPEARIVRGIPFTEYVINIINTCNLDGILPTTNKQKKN